MHLFIENVILNCVLDMKARSQVIVNVQGRNSTRKFTTLDNYSWEIHKECDMESAGVEHTNLLRSQAVNHFENMYSTSIFYIKC